MYVLGISCYYHDAAAALLSDGMLVAAAEEERFSRKKHDYGYPEQAISFCLDQAGITADELDYVVFYEKPLLKYERILLTSMGTFPSSWAVFRESMVTWFNEKLWIKGRILSHLGIPDDKLLFVEHHLSHAASAMFASPFEEAAIVTVDGVGEWTTTTIGEGSAYWEPTVRPQGQERPQREVRLTNQIQLHREERFPHSLGLLYSSFTAFLGFRVNSGEYKVMGMAPYGRPTRMDDVYKLIHVADDGSFDLDMNYFAFHRSTHQSYSRKFTDLFGPPRVHESDFFTPTTHPHKDHPLWDDSIAQVNQHYADIAASVQQVTEETLLKIVRKAYELTGKTKLCMAGGVALNSVANGKIQRESPFDDVFIQPAAGDSGGALGAALYVYHVLLGHPRRYVMEHAYWGKSYSDDEVRNTLDRGGHAYEFVEDTDRLADRMVDDLVSGRVISLFQGRFEWGPRALGNRSILADPRQSEMKEIVNETIKFREPFRPFAPVVLEERAADFYKFQTGKVAQYPLRFMLMVFPTKDGQGERIPAVTHQGGTGRLQTVRREWNPLYYRVIEKFGEATGVPVLLNTSFNLRGEPIVTSPQNALNTFTSSGMDTLYMEHHVIRKSST